VLPNSRELSGHMTADRGFRPARMAWTIWRDTPRAFAAVAADVHLARIVVARLSADAVSLGTARTLLLLHSGYTITFP
jgi:hypothetical protein